MGGKVSIADTPLGRSLIGKAYRTKTETVCFGYCGYDKEYVLCKWSDRGSPVNPAPGSFDLQILAPVEFEIIYMDKTTGIGGTYIHTKIHILHDIVPETVGAIRECVDASIGWEDRSDLSAVKSRMLDLSTEGKRIGLYTFELGLNLAYNYFDTSVPFPELPAGFKYLEEIE